MSPDARMTVAPMPGPVSAAARRPRRLTPMTSWLALTERAKSTRAAGHVFADDLVVGAAEGFDQSALGGQRPGVGGASAVLAGHVHGEQLTAGERAAMRAPRRISVSPSGPPVSATTTRSRACQVPWMPCSAR